MSLDPQKQSGPAFPFAQYNYESNNPVNTNSTLILPVLTGSANIGESVIASLPTGYLGTLQFTKTLIASPFTKSNIVGAVATTVNNLSYQVQSGDLGSKIGCDVVNIIYPSNNIQVTPSNFADIVIFAGQSQGNNNGTDVNGGDVPVALQGPMTNMLTWDPFNRVWLTYEAGVNSAVHFAAGSTAKYHGPEAEYLRRYKEQYPTSTLYMVKEAYSSTSLSPLARTTGRGCWDPSLTGVNTDLFEQMVTRVSDACSNLRLAGKTPRIKVFNWIQGENDAGVLAAANLYNANETALINAVRTRLDGASSDTIFTIARVQLSGTYSSTIRTAQVAVAAAVANTRWVDADDCAISVDGLHYSPAGCVTLGRLMSGASMTGVDIATRYFSRMTAQPVAGRQTALTTLFETLAAKSVWSTVTSMFLFASHDQQSALQSAGYVPLAAVPTNQTFAADLGFTGSGSGSHINTNYIPASTDPRYILQKAGASIWIRQKPVAGGIDIGVFNGGTLILDLSTTTNIRVFASSDVANVVTGVPQTTGFATVQRLGPSDSRLYLNGAQLGTPATSPFGPSLPVVPIWVGDRNGGSSAPTTSAQYCVFITGLARTAQQESDLYTALNTYLVSIGAA